MNKEYKIKCKVPGKSALDTMFRRLPSPIHRAPWAEIYNYKINADGFYFIDHLVDTKTASLALRVFIDAALLANQTIEISVKMLSFDMAAWYASLSHDQVAVFSGNASRHHAFTVDFSFLSSR